MADPDPKDEPVRAAQNRSALNSLHALLGALPVGYFLLAFLIDLTYISSTFWMWPVFSVWLITAGLVAGGLAVLIGPVDWLVRRRTVRARGFAGT